jgi:hypothetical protein
MEKPDTLWVKMHSFAESMGPIVEKPDTLWLKMHPFWNSADPL